MDINNHDIKLIKDYQCLYGPIYSQGLVELEILKAYIQNNLANDFIRPFKSPIRPPILFDLMSNRILRLYINYEHFNHLTFKNKHSFSLVGELLDRFS